ncbi:hypothetical protein KEM55_008965, partial [Ascosphaera atra]
SLQKKERRKLSNKDKKRLDQKKAMQEGRMWKKGKAVREDPKAGKPVKAKGKGKGKPAKGGNKPKAAGKENGKK